MKIRYYGFMSPGSSVSLGKIATLIELAFGFEIETPKTEIEPFKPPTCANCGGNLKYIASVLPFNFILSGAG